MEESTNIQRDTINTDTINTNIIGADTIDTNTPRDIESINIIEEENTTIINTMAKE